MNKSLILMTTLLGIGSALADYPATVLDDSPLAYFRFEEAAGASFAADSSGNGNDAANYADLGNGVIGVTGAIGNAIQFNGDGGIVTGLTFDPSTSDFSMELLIKPDVVDSETRVVISNRDGEGLGRSNASIGANGQINSFAGGTSSNSGIQAIPNDWQHVVYTYEDSTDTMRIFVNGVEGTPTVLANLATPRSVESGNGEWIIGAQKLLNQQFTRGIVDEVAIYDTRLDDPNGDSDSVDSRITAHYEAYRDDTGLFNFNTDRIYADSGEPVELSWTVSPTMTSLEIDNGVGDILGGLTAAADGRMEGGVTVNPTTTTTYTLSGTNPFESDSLSVEVNVDALPVIDVFVSNFDEVIATQSVELSWTITNADTSEIDQGIGALVTNPGLVTTGSQTTVINEGTTFTLTATNGAGSVTAEVNITTREGDPSLLAHWKVGEEEGETEGTTLISDTGEGFNGTFVGTPAFDSEDPAPVPTGSSASLVFDGNNSWVDILGWTGVGGSTSRTVAFWFKGEAPQTNNNATLVSWGTNATEGRWDIRLNSGASGVIRTEVAGGGSNGSTFIGDNAWHHVAIVLPDDGSPTIGEALFYIDGQPDAFSATGGTDINTTTTNNVRIGAARALANRSLTGKMDDIRVYNRALDAEEILVLVEGEPIVEELAINSLVRNEDGSVSLEWNAQPGSLYFVEFSSTLEDGSWLEIADEVQNGEYLDTTFGPTNQFGFYRVREAE